MKKQTKTIIWVAVIGIGAYLLWKKYGKPSNGKVNKSNPSEAKLNVTAGGCPPGQTSAVITVVTDQGYIDEVTGERVGVKTKKIVKCVPIETD